MGDAAAGAAGVASRVSRAARKAARKTAAAAASASTKPRRAHHGRARARGAAPASRPLLVCINRMLRADAPAARGGAPGRRMLGDSAGRTLRADGAATLRVDSATAVAPPASVSAPGSRTLAGIAGRTLREDGAAALRDDRASAAALQASGFGRKKTPGGASDALRADAKTPPPRADRRAVGRCSMGDAAAPAADAISTLCGPLLRSADWPAATAGGATPRSTLSMRSDGFSVAIAAPRRLPPAASRAADTRCLPPGSEYSNRPDGVMRDSGSARCGPLSVAACRAERPLAVLPMRTRALSPPSNELMALARTKKKRETNDQVTI